MTASNDFLTFAIGGSANVVSQATYASAPEVTNGFQTGIARSNLVNKAVRQSAFVASQIAQYMANRLATAIQDNGDATTFLAQVGDTFGNLPGGANRIPFQSADGVTSYTPAPSASGQVPTWDGSTWVLGTGGGDVVHWNTPGSGSGYIVGGNGIIRQWVTAVVPASVFASNSLASFTWPITFPADVIIDSIVVGIPARASDAGVSTPFLGYTNLTTSGVQIFFGGGAVSDVADLTVTVRASGHV